MPASSTSTLSASFGSHVAASVSRKPRTTTVKASGVGERKTLLRSTVAVMTVPTTTSTSHPRSRKSSDRAHPTKVASASPKLPSSSPSPASPTTSIARSPTRDPTLIPAPVPSLLPLSLAVTPSQEVPRASTRPIDRPTRTHTVITLVTAGQESASTSFAHVSSPLGSTNSAQSAMIVGQQQVVMLIFFLFVMRQLLYDRHL